MRRCSSRAAWCSSRAASVAIIPSALFSERFSLGGSWASSFQRVLLPDNRPWLSSLGREGLRRSHLNSAVELGSSDPTLGHGTHHFAIVPQLLMSSPLTHNLCRGTANFRATAMTARFLAFFPPRSASFRPQRRRSLSSPKARECSAHLAPTGFLGNGLLPC
jgi:hypothetical protein